MRVLLISVVVALLAVGCFAGDLSAKWNGTVEIKTPEGEMVNLPFWAEFHQNGTEVTGTAGGGDSPESLPIDKGVFDGKKLGFEITGLDGRLYTVSLNSMDEDRLEGTIDFALPDGTQMNGKLVLKREKPA